MANYNIREIIEQINCLAPLEDEVLKLLCVFRSLKGEKVEASYVIEKLENLINKHPIIMHELVKCEYISLKTGKHVLTTIGK